MHYGWGFGLFWGGVFRGSFVPFFVVLGSCSWFLFFLFLVLIFLRFGFVLIAELFFSHKELLKSFQNIFFQKKKKANKSTVSLRKGGGRALIQVTIASLQGLHFLFFFFFLKTLLLEWYMWDFDLFVTSESML